MSKRKKYLFLTMSGLGYLYPSIRLAHILQTNFHHVLFVSTHEHSLILTHYGIEHVPMKGRIRRFLDLHRWGNAENAINDFGAVDDIVNKYRPDVIITSPLAMLSFVFGEKYQIPIINIGFCEYLFPAKFSDDVVKNFCINQFTEFYNSYREKLGLGLIENSATESPLIGTKYLLRSVSRLNDDIVLPDQVQCIGDLYFEPEYINKPMSNFIAASRASGRRIVYIQIGRLFKGADVWEKLLSVFTQLPINFVVDIGRADYSTKAAKMHRNFFISPFIPIGAVKDDIDFVICTCQTTSVVSAIIHGKQLLAIPHSADSTDLAKRLESKNLAFGIYEAEDISLEKISKLFLKLNSNHLTSSVIEYKKQFASFTDEIIYDVIKSV